MVRTKQTASRKKKAAKEAAAAAEAEAAATETANPTQEDNTVTTTMDLSSSISKKRDGDGVFDDAIENEEVPVPAAKKARTTTSDKDESHDDEDEDLFAAPPVAAPQEQRTANLSKFVRRMLDPNRKPRGLIEPPQVIPLNDEFLQAFGQREKEFDIAVTGKESEFEQTIVETEEAQIEASLEKQAQAKEEKEKEDNRKIKIFNLKYTTTAATLKEECLNFGPVQEVNLLMDENDANRNTGRAYVIFETSQAAEQCVEQQLGGTLDGRPVRVSLALENKKGSHRDDPRYWQRDISTKCFRCGQVGHMENDCNNKSKRTTRNVCPLCATVDEHELRHCPLNRVCFNCGIPGHISRDCKVPRGSQPPRRICTICCGSGHTRFQCQRGGANMNIPGFQEAVCLVCHQKGHFMCKELKWFFGLDGVFCSNCGGKGHVGDQCKRPNLDDLCRSDGWALKEVERAEEYTLADEMEMERVERERKERERQQKRHEERDRNRNRYREQDQNRNRARSAPPPPNRGYNNNGGGGGQEFRYDIGGNGNGNNNNNRGYSNNNNNRGGGGGRRRGYR